MPLLKREGGAQRRTERVYLKIASELKPMIFSLKKSYRFIRTCVYRLYLNDKCSKSLVRTGVRKSVLTQSVKGEALQKFQRHTMTLKLVDQPRNKNPILLKKMSKKSRSKLRINHPILSGCLQYFNTDTGLLRSFNFVPASTFGSSGLVRTSDTHLANQDYKICIQVS